MSLFSNESLVLGLLVVVFLVVLLGFFLARKRCYIIAKPLLTENELEFYQRLRKALPEFTVLTQVSMSAFLRPSCAASEKEFWSARGRFAQKFSDFVICDSNTMEIKVVIELDDRTHVDAKDELRDQMLAEAGIDTLRFASKSKPSHREIRQAVLAL